MAQNCSHFTHMENCSLIPCLWTDSLVCLRRDGTESHFNTSVAQKTTAHTVHPSAASFLWLENRLSLGEDTIVLPHLHPVMSISPSQWHPASYCNPRALLGTPGLSLRCLRWTPWILNSFTLPDWKINSVNFNWQLIWNLKWGNEWIALVSSKGR